MLRLCSYWFCKHSDTLLLHRGRWGVISESAGSKQPQLLIHHQEQRSNCAVKCALFMKWWHTVHIIDITVHLQNLQYENVLWLYSSDRPGRGSFHFSWESYLQTAAEYIHKITYIHVQFMRLCLCLSLLVSCELSCKSPPSPLSVSGGRRCITCYHGNHIVVQGVNAGRVSHSLRVQNGCRPVAIID